MLALFIVGAAAGSAYAWYWHWTRPVREAQEAYDARNYELALRWSNYRLRQNPSDAEALRLQARAHARLNNYSRAIELFFDFPDLEGEDYLLLGMCQAQTQDLLKAGGNLQRAVELSPTAEARRMLAVVYAQLDRDDLAYEQAKLVAEGEDETDLGLALIGQLLYRSRPQASLDAYAKLLERNPELIGIPQSRRDVQLNQVESLTYLGRIDQAWETIERVSNVETDVRALELRGRLRQFRGETEGALADWKLALELAPNNAEIMVDLALGLLDGRREKEAIEWLIKASSLADDWPEVHQNLAIAYTRVGNKEAAESHKQRAQQLRRQVEQRQLQQMRPDRNVGAGSPVKKGP